MPATGRRPREEWFYPSHNFGALPPSLSKAETSRVVVLPVPYEGTTTYRSGCRRGPSAIIEASMNMELYDEELCREPCKVGIHTSEPLDVIDDPQEMIERIDIVATSYLRKKKFVTLLGGEHTVSVGMVRALSRTHADLSILFLDAHADFRESYHGNKYSHACAARRISEICPVVQAGVRSLSSEEAAGLKKSSVTTFWAEEFRKARCSAAFERMSERITSHLSANVYISIDADVFDPSVMPAVGTPEPGGLEWDEVLTLLRAVTVARRVVGIDFVELAPVEGLVHPEFAAARLLYKAWGFALKG